MFGLVLRAPLPLLHPLSETLLLTSLQNYFYHPPLLRPCYQLYHCFRIDITYIQEKVIIKKPCPGTEVSVDITKECLFDE